MKTYILKLNSGTAYKLYDGTTLVSDTALGTLFGSAGSAYFTFDFNSSTPSDLTAVSITDSNDTEVMGITGLAAGTVKENYNFEGSWDGTTTTFTSFAQLTGKAMDDAELSFLMNKIKSAGPGKAKMLTEADYNWNKTTGATGTPDTIALWLLEPGMYQFDGYDLWYTPSSGNSYQASQHQSMLILEGANRPSDKYYSYAIMPDESGNIYTWYYRQGASGTFTQKKLLSSTDIATSTGNSNTKVMSQNSVTTMVYPIPSNLSRIGIGGGSTASANYAISLGSGSSSTSTHAIAIGADSSASATGAIALGSFTSASTQGVMNIGPTDTTFGYNSSNYRLLTGVYDGQSAHDAATKGQLDGRVLTNAGAPTTATVGTVGQLLEDTTNGALYQCTAVTPGTDPDPDTYTWEEVGGGGTIATINSTDWSNLWQ